MGNGTVDTTPTPVTFANRIRRLEEVVTRLTQLYHDLAETQRAEAESKASIYLNHAGSHAERDATARHNSVGITSDVIAMKAEIQQLQEERDFLQFIIDRVE